MSTRRQRALRYGSDGAEATRTCARGRTCSEEGDGSEDAKMDNEGSPARQNWAAKVDDWSWERWTQSLRIWGPLASERNRGTKGKIRRWGWRLGHAVLAADSGEGQNGTPTMRWSSGSWWRGEGGTVAVVMTTMAARAREHAASAAAWWRSPGSGVITGSTLAQGTHRVVWGWPERNQGGGAIAAGGGEEGATACCGGAEAELRWGMD